jgi:hypothetical protein
MLRASSRFVTFTLAISHSTPAAASSASSAFFTFVSISESP